ncbi:MAG: hypothetical protein O3A66_02555 [Proteobacteria bacterium]|nr:hypothetical protein [Pseudomonadota bacterium]
MQKFINIDEKRNGHDQTNDKLREQKLNTRKSFLRLNFLNSENFRQFSEKNSASTKQGNIRVSAKFRQFQLIILLTENKNLGGNFKQNKGM